MKTVGKVFAFIDKIIMTGSRFFATIAVAAFTIIIFCQVIGRTIFRLPMIWSMDVSTLCFTWCVFIGSTLAVYNRSHYNVAIFPKKWAKLNSALDILGDLIGILLFACLIYYGFQYTKLGAKRISDSLGITMNYFYFVIPFSACFMLYFQIEVLVKDLIKLVKQFQGKNAEETTDRDQAGV